MKCFVFYFLVLHFHWGVGDENSKLNGENICGYCERKFNTFISEVQYGQYSESYLQEKLQFYCVLFEATGKICDSIIRTYLPTIQYVMANTPNISGAKICQILLQASACDKYLEKLEPWRLDIHPTNVAAVYSKSYIPAGSTQNLNILQITDVHYDPHYEVGAYAMCSDAICCRHINNTAPVENRAGKWGYYNRCDIPLSTFENTLAHIKRTQPKIDIIYMTGDFIDHTLQRAPWSDYFHVISTVMRKLVEAFPDSSIYPIIGNHEGNPGSVYAPTYISSESINTQPLYDFLIDEWHWLPYEARCTLKAGGYYTVLIRPGLRLIAINNNVCLVDNWWLLFDTSEVIQSLQWIENVLYYSELSGEYVHILAHIPSNSDSCYREWSKQYNRIIERYYKIISAQFNGHTHRDQFYIQFSTEHPFTAINVAWNGGSIATWNNVNPNYRMYSVEPQSYQVTDFETWIFNMTAANLDETSAPNWFLEYKFREAYNIQDLSPASLTRLVYDMATNKTKLEQYWRYFVKQGDPFLKIGCDNNCLEMALCEIVTTTFLDFKPRCPYFINVFRSNL